MRVLALGRDLPGLSKEDFQPHLKAETLRVIELYTAGILREIYFMEEAPNAVLILECENKTEATKCLDTLPLVKEKLIEFEIIPLVPYPGFGRLFAGDLEN